MPTWMNQNGRLSCTEHGGQYLKAAVASNPPGRAHETPIDHWLLIGEDDEPAIKIALDTDTLCETCRAQRDISLGRPLNAQ